jgi:hypothetical protein
MQIDKLVALWQGYRQRGVNPTIHPDDHTFKSNPLLDDYEIVGESGLQVIHSVLAMSRKEAVYNVLDFGCGHGRVARYVRAMFPKANLSFSDIDPSCTDFCATQFSGKAVQSTADLSQLTLPHGMSNSFRASGSEFERSAHCALLLKRLRHGAMHLAL